MKTNRKQLLQLRNKLQREIEDLKKIEFAGQKIKTDERFRLCNLIKEKKEKYNFINDLLKARNLK